MEPTEAIENNRMPLWQHLDELRKIFVRVLIAVLISFAVTWNYVERIIYFLEKPLLNVLPENERYLYFTGLTEKFFIYFKVSALTSIALISPYLLYEIWNFIAPALYKNEKRFAFPLVMLGGLAFVLGNCFCYFFMLPYSYRFLVQFGSSSDKALITLQEYFSLTLQLMLISGVLFELPVVLMLLARLGIVEVVFLKKYRRHAYVLLAVVAAILTPTPDAFTMFLVLIPLFVLYEISILLAKWASRPKIEYVI